MVTSEVVQGVQVMVVVVVIKCGGGCYGRNKCKCFSVLLLLLVYFLSPSPFCLDFCCCFYCSFGKGVFVGGDEISVFFFFCSNNGSISVSSPRLPFVSREAGLVRGV